MQLKRGVVSFSLDANLSCDPLLLRYARKVERAVRAFGAELVHITGPGDMGCLGLYVASRLKLPLVISWHMSLHKYAAERLRKIVRFAGGSMLESAAIITEGISLAILDWFYSKGDVLLAPNKEAVHALSHSTGRPCFLMGRGVDTDLFSPRRRRRNDRTFRLGYVGRLTPEKNVRFLAQLGNALARLGHNNFEFIVVGQGSEYGWLREHVPHVKLTGVLAGEALAATYANMDLFVFPSRTDTFGNVVLEALSSAVPAVVTAHGGPKFLIQNGVTGYVAGSDAEFIRRVTAIVSDSAMQERMRAASRSFACTQTWDSALEDVYRHYAEALASSAHESRRH